MKPFIFVLAVVVVTISFPVFGCDQGASRKVQGMMRDMGSWQEKSGVITFKWKADWDQLSPDERLGLIRGFADSDACLTGRPREISFYRMGKLVGKASPAAGIRLIQ